jgi:hypothetical protein
MKCRDCDNEARENRAMCVVCLDKASARTRELNRIAIEGGLCVSCRKSPYVHSNLCASCVAAKKASNIRRKARYIAENRCTKCGRSKSSVSAWHHTWCAGCQLVYKFGFTGTWEEAETVVNELLTRQEFRCALSGRDLQTNKYHIDHIIPRSLRPDLASEPSNWQLIVEEANVLKSGMSVDQLVSLCSDIVKHTGGVK